MAKLFNKFSIKSYFQGYLNDVEQIHLKHNVLIILKHLTAIFFILLEMLIHAVQSQNAGSIDDQIRSFNMAHLVMGNNLFNTVWIFIGTMTVIIMVKIYFLFNWNIHNLLKRLLNKERNVFLFSKFKNSNSFDYFLKHSSITIKVLNRLTFIVLGKQKYLQLTLNRATSSGGASVYAKIHCRWVHWTHVARLRVIDLTKNNGNFVVIRQKIQALPLPRWIGW